MSITKTLNDIINRSPEGSEVRRVAGTMMDFFCSGIGIDLSFAQQHFIKGRIEQIADLRNQRDRDKETQELILFLTALANNQALGILIHERVRTLRR